MEADLHQQSTEITQLGSEAPAPSLPRDPVIVPALTIAYHPVLRRIGDLARDSIRFDEVR
jgi:hypothetical protein